MEDKKGCEEQMVKAQAITLNLEVEELEKRVAPKLAQNHNETMLRDDA